MPNIPDNTPLWLTVLIFLYMGVLAFLQIRTTNKKNNSESKVNDAAAKLNDAAALEKISAAYDQLLENMQERLVKVEAKLKKFELWVPRLIDQIHQLGGVPVDPPDTGDLVKNSRP